MARAHMVRQNRLVTQARISRDHSGQPAMNQTAHTSAHAELLRRIDELASTKVLFPNAAAIERDRATILPFYVRWLDVEPLIHEVRAAIAQMAEDLERLRRMGEAAQAKREQAEARIVTLSADFDQLLANHDAIARALTAAEARVREETAIVDRVWRALGISTYEEAKGKAIDELVADLQEQLREAEARLQQPNDTTGQDRLLMNEYGRCCYESGERAAKAEAEAARAPLVEKVSSRNNSHIEDTVAQLLIDLAFLLPRGTDIRTTIGPRLVAFKEALEARQREAARAPLLALVERWRQEAKDGHEEGTCIEAWGLEECAAELEAALAPKGA